MKQVCYKNWIVLVLVAFITVCGNKKNEEIKQVESKETVKVLKAPDGMVLIPAGESADVFYIDKYEVTNAQYKKFCDATNHNYPEDPKFKGMRNYLINYPDYPIVNISWNDATAYAKWARKRLPSWKEWKFAAGNADRRTYPWGEGLDYDKANYVDTGATYNFMAGSTDRWIYTAPVGSFEYGKSPYGIYDMAGNVWEWVADQNDNMRIACGGSYHVGGNHIRIRSRRFLPPDAVNVTISFRCAKSIEK